LPGVGVSSEKKLTTSKRSVSERKRGVVSVGQWIDLDTIKI